MGRIKANKNGKNIGLWRRWLINTVGVVSVLGLACVLIIIAVFATAYYSSMESDLMYVAKNTSNTIANESIQDAETYYQYCIAYTQTFKEDDIELQFLDTTGKVVSPI